MVKLKLDAQSYLKSGSNELRVLEYRTGGMSFGINILKVNKISSELTNFTRVPETHPSIAGVFRDRNRLVPVVDLAHYLGVRTARESRQKVIVTEFFGVTTGFWVDTIDWIHHFKWEDVIDTGNVFGEIDHRYVIGIVKPTEERMVQLLDYETILLDLCPELRQRASNVSKATDEFSGRRVLVAEDSPAVRSMLGSELTEMGCHIDEAGDGQQAWELFGRNAYDLVICDVEMPRMDGLALTLKIRQRSGDRIPVIVYSSIGDIGMKARAEFLKADAHNTKLNMERLIDTVGKLLRGEKVSRAETGFGETAVPVIETVPMD